MFKLVCSKCGYVIYVYRRRDFQGMLSAHEVAGTVCPKCKHKFKGKIKRILFDGEVIYEG